MFCATTRNSYLDRGDGIYQQDGGVVEARLVNEPAVDLLSDRPARTADKTRITLERATFA